MAFAVIDRFEGEKAVLLVGEAEKEAVFPKSELPEEAAEGDYLKIDITIDHAATEAAMQEAAELLKELKGEK